MKYLIIVLLLLLPTIAQAETKLRLETRWPGVHIVWHEELQLKSVVAEFDTFLAVVEFPHNDATVRSLLVMLREKFPAKPVRFAFHTHHHDHSVGALDPLLAANVVVITSPSNLMQIQKLVSDPSLLAGKVITVKEEFSLSDSFNSLTAYVLQRERYEVPTDEYIIVHFPRTKAVVSGCLFNKPLTYWEVVNTRKTSLNKFLSEKSFTVDWLIPTNTTSRAGFEDVCTVNMLKETLEKGIKPAEVAVSLKAKTVEELRSKFNSLAEEFKIKTPRSYDIIVCANYLKIKEQDYDRAIILFEVASHLFPKEADPHRYIAECWGLKGESVKKLESLKRALELVTSESEKKELREEIENCCK